MLSEEAAQCARTQLLRLIEAALRPFGHRCQQALSMMVVPKKREGCSTLALLLCLGGVEQIDVIVYKVAKHTRI